MMLTLRPTIYILSALVGIVIATIPSAVGKTATQVSEPVAVGDDTPVPDNDQQMQKTAQDALNTQQQIIATQDKVDQMIHSLQDVLVEVNEMKSKECAKKNTKMLHCFDADEAEDAAEARAENAIPATAAAAAK